MSNVVIQGFPSNGSYTRSDILGYKSYAFQIKQYGSNTPIVNELSNDFGPMTWNQSGAGLYQTTLPTPIPVDKFWMPNATEFLGNSSCVYTMADGSAVTGYILISPIVLPPSYSFVSGVWIYCYDNTFSAVDLSYFLEFGGVAGNVYFEFRQYN